MSKGFTLIEILIVMVVLGILTLVAVPKYIDFTEQAEIVSTETELQTIYRALYIYSAIHGRMPNKLSEIMFTANIDDKYELNPQGRIL